MSSDQGDNSPPLESDANEDIQSNFNISFDFENTKRSEAIDTPIELKMTEVEPDTKLASPKRRKVTADFVTPSTPDIPKASSQYGYSSMTEHSTVDSNIGLIDSSDPSNDFKVDVPKDPYTPCGDEVRKDRAVGDVLKELGQEAKMINLQWLQVFSDSENFELFCPTRLNKLLEEAKSLEENLKHQKEILCRRLKGLSRTLQLL